MSYSTKESTEKYTTAKDFLDVLHLSSDRWLPSSLWRSPWVFRGQRDAKWDLTPKAWRSKNTSELKRLEKLKQHYAHINRYSLEKMLSRIKKDFNEKELENLIEAYSQARAEFQLILEFLSLADELGHPVPGAEQYLRLSSYDYLPNISKYPLMRFLPEPNAATALAQHHGIPTRAIDWTNNPLIAAFFAAEGISHDTDEGCIAVWAIRSDLLGQYIMDQIQKREFSQFKVLKLPRSENSFLHAQDGLFISPINGCSYYAKNGSWPMLEEYALDVALCAREEVIRKLTLPYDQVGELLRLLWANGISRGHLMPTYDNVTRSLVAKWEWWDY